MRRIVFLATVFSFFVVKGIGQIKLDLNDVRKLILTETVSGMDSSSGVDYEVVYGNGRWVSYRTSTHKESLFDKASNKDSVQRSFIKVVVVDSIRSFFKTISVIKPEYNPANLGFTVDNVTREINESYFKKDPIKARIFDEYFNTPEKLNKLLTQVHNEAIMDIGFFNRIYIINKNGDTAKISSNQQQSLMLPWNVNNVDTYDSGISRFFAYASNTTGRVSKSNFLSTLYNIVYYQKAREAFGFTYWQQAEPDNTKYLQQYFTVTDVEDGAMGYYCKLLYKNYHIVINTILNIHNKPQLNRLVSFAADTVQLLLHSQLFMIDSCLKGSSCKVVFDNTLGSSSKKFPMAYMGVLDKQLKKIYNVAVCRFSISDAAGGEEDEWIVLPNKTFLLVTYFREGVTGVPSKYLKGDGKDSPNVALKVFSHDGKLLRTFSKKGMEFDNMKRLLPAQKH